MSYINTHNRRYRILIACTVQCIRTELTHILEDSGLDVIASVRDSAAVARVSRALKPDISILDTILPEHSGAEIARAFDRLKLGPVVLLNTRPEKGFSIMPELRGVYGSITAPLTTGRILPVVELALHRWKEKRSLDARIFKLERGIESRDIVSNAKFLLMEQHGLPERDAYRRLQLLSMNLRKPIGEIAEAVILTNQIQESPQAA
jgi:AmiR/NasT family two-component response regulator